MVTATQAVATRSYPELGIQLVLAFVHLPKPINMYASGLCILLEEDCVSMALQRYWKEADSEGEKLCTCLFTKA